MRKLRVLNSEYFPRIDLIDLLSKLDKISSNRLAIKITLAELPRTLCEVSEYLQNGDILVVCLNLTTPIPTELIYYYIGILLKRNVNVLIVTKNAFTLSENLDIKYIKGSFDGVSLANKIISLVTK